MALWSWQAIAHGADAVMFFQWRQSRGGAEKFHSGMIPHSGADTRVFREVRELGRSLAAVPDLEVSGIVTTNPQRQAKAREAYPYALVVPAADELWGSIDVLVQYLQIIDRPKFVDG